MRLTVTYSTKGRHRKVGCSLWPQSANTRLMSFCSRSSLNNKRNPSTVWRRCLLLFASILMLPGCTYSTNPIFVEQDNLFDEAFLGTWEADEEAKLEFRRFEVERWGPEEKSYRAVLRNERGEKQDPSLQLFLSQIDGKKFITAKFEQPDSEKVSPETADAAAMYLTFAMDRCEGGELQMRYLLERWLANQVKTDPSILKHEWNARPDKKKMNHLRITAPTAELRTFVLEHYDKREAWVPLKFKKIR